MSLSTQRHGNLHRSKKILLMLQEVQGGMEIRSTNRGSAWQYASFEYHHNHEEWDENLENDEIEHVLS